MRTREQQGWASGRSRPSASRIGHQGRHGSTFYSLLPSPVISLGRSKQMDTVKVKASIIFQENLVPESVHWL